METLLLPIVGPRIFVGSGERERAGESLDSLPSIVLLSSSPLPPFPLLLEDSPASHQSPEAMESAPHSLFG